MKKYIFLPALMLFAAQGLRSQTNVFPASGNAGIGTLSPAEKLHIYRNQLNYYNPLLVIEDGLAAGYTQMAIRGTGRSYHIGVGNASEAGFGLANKFYIWDQNAVAPRVTVDANGNMGIGTTAPGSRLSIYAGSASSSGLQFSRLNNTSPATTSNGKVLALDAAGNVILVNDMTAAGWSFSGNAGTNPTTSFIGTTDLQDLSFRTNGIERFRLLSNGNLRLGGGTDRGKTIQVNGTGFFSGSVGIGTDSINDPNYRLFVASGIRTRKLKVDVNAWPDYVFDERYTLPTLAEIESYIREHKHLPGILTASEAERDGIDVGEVQAALLRKIEELTLYAIEQNKATSKLLLLIENQQAEINALKTAMSVE